MKNVVKTIIFLIAWMLSFFCGIYLFGAIFMGMNITTMDIIMNACGFTLSMLWLWFNSVRV
jgi:hypothetical protein